MSFSPTIGLLVSLIVAAAQTPPDPLARARERYNSHAYEEAIALAGAARAIPALANAARVVEARSYLERYRGKQEHPDPTDLIAARQALVGVDASLLSAKDYVEYLVGLGEALYLEAGVTEQQNDRYGAAADMFERALSRAEAVMPKESEPVFEWWANAIDRQAQLSPEAANHLLYARLLAGAERRLDKHGPSAVATYWLAAAARGTGDLDRAYGTATAGWIRAREFGPAAAKLRKDLDELIVSVILPERAKRLPPEGDAHQLLESLKAQWAAVKAQWGGGS